MATLAEILEFIAGLGGGFGQALQQNRVAQQQEALTLHQLRQGQGEFLPVPTAEAFGGSRLRQFFGVPEPGITGFGGQSFRYQPYGTFTEADVANLLGKAAPTETETTTAPGVPPRRTDLGPARMLVGTPKTPEVRRLLATQSMTELRQLKLAEQTEVRTTRNAILADLKGRNVVVPNAFRQSLIAATTMDELSELMATAPSQATVKVTISGQETEVPLSEYWKYLQTDQSERRLGQQSEQTRISNERLALSLENLAQRKTEETRRQSQFERGPMAPEEAAARKRLGLSVSEPLSPEANASVGEEMLRFRGQAATQTTTAQEQAKEPGRERAAERAKELKLTQPLSREQAIVAKARGIAAKSTEDLTAEDAQAIRDDIRTFQIDEFTTRATAGAEILDQRQRAVKLRELKTTLLQATTVISEMQAAWDAVNKHGLISGPGVRAARNLTRLTEGFAGHLSRLGGDRGGILSNQDISRAMNLVPSPYVSPKAFGDDAFVQLQRLVKLWRAGMDDIYGPSGPTRGASDLDVLRQELRTP